MSSANVRATGLVVPLDRPPQPNEQATESDVQDASKLARTVTGLLKSLASLARRWWPDRLDFEDVACSGVGGTIRLEHRLGGRVRWYLVDWNSSAGPQDIRIDPTQTTDNVLVLVSYTAGTATIRVEEAGA